MAVPGLALTSLWPLLPFSFTFRCLAMSPEEPLNAYQNFQFEGALGQRLQKLGLLIGIGLLCITRFGPLNISEEKLQIQKESNILHP